MPPELRSLLQLAFVSNPSERLSLEELRAHPFCTAPGMRCADDKELACALEQQDPVHTNRQVEQLPHTRRIAKQNKGNLTRSEQKKLFLRLSSREDSQRQLDELGLDTPLIQEAPAHILPTAEVAPKQHPLDAPEMAISARVHGRKCDESPFPIDGQRKGKERRVPRRPRVVRQQLHFARRRRRVRWSLVDALHF